MTTATDPTTAAIDPTAGTAPPAAIPPEAPPAPPGDAETGPEVKGFDFVSHESVQSMRKEGIWTFLGERFGGIQVRLRPFYESAVIVKKESSEQAIRLQLGLSDDEALPGDKTIQVNRDAVTMAVTGCRGRIRGNGPMVDLARRSGWQVEDDGWIILAGHEEAAEIRELFGFMMDSSTHLLTTLVAASRGLHHVRDSEVTKLGEGFVYGLHVAADWAD